MNTIQSEFLKLSKNDMVRGLVVSVFAAVLTLIEQSLTTSVPLDIHQIVQIALIAGLSYLSKNFLTTSDGKIMGVF